MNLQSIVRTISKNLVDNSPSIMTGAAVAGVIGTAVLAAKGHSEAQRIQDPVEEISVKDYVQRHWKLYLPAVTSGTATIICIVGAHTTLSKRHAAILGAYSLSERAFKEYREKIVETIGENQERKARDEIARERLERNPAENNTIIYTGIGDQLCYDVLTGRYFKSDIEKIRKAQNDINAKIINDGHASLNEFYALLGLESTGMGEDLGWTTDAMMDIFFSTHLSSEGQACLSMEYHSTPVRDYWRAFG